MDEKYPGNDGDSCSDDCCRHCGGKARGVGGGEQGKVWLVVI